MARKPTLETASSHAQFLLADLACLRTLADGPGGLLPPPVSEQVAKFHKLLDDLKRGYTKLVAAYEEALGELEASAIRVRDPKPVSVGRYHGQFGLQVVKKIVERVIDCLGLPSRSGTADLEFWRAQCWDVPRFDDLDYLFEVLKCERKSALGKGGRPSISLNGTGPGQFSSEVQAILFIEERINTTGRLPTKTAIADVLGVTPRTLNNWHAFKVAYKQLQSKSRRQPPRGSKGKDGTMEAWRENGKKST